MHVRLMTRADVPACAAIMAGTWLWQRYGVTEDQAARRFRDGLARGATVFVAEVDAQVVGFVWCEPRGAFARSGYIPLIGVAEGYRGMGVGAALLARAEDFLARTARDVFLLVSDFNTGAQRFYERHGYVRVGALPDYVIEGVTEYIYRKRLED